MDLPQKIVDEILLLVGQCEFLKFVAETQEEGLPFFQEYPHANGHEMIVDGVPVALDSLAQPEREKTTEEISLLNDRSVLQIHIRKKICVKNSTYPSEPTSTAILGDT